MTEVPTSKRAHIVVRNTFIDAVDPVDADAPPNRTISDQTGLRSNNYFELARAPSRLADPPRPIAEDGVEDDDGVPGTRISEPYKSYDSYEDDAHPRTVVDIPCKSYDEFEDDDGPLLRTKSVGHPSMSRPVAAPTVIPQATIAEAPAEEEAAADAEDIPATSEEPLVSEAVSSTLTAVSDADRSQKATTLQVADAIAEPEPGAAAASSFAFAQMMPMAPWGMMAAYPVFGMMPGGGYPNPFAGTNADGQDGEEDGTGGNYSSQLVLPELGKGPPLGYQHTFHSETLDMGCVTPDFRQFTKVGYEGRLSVVTENQIQQEGFHRYLVQFSAGELSRADGVGFVFSGRLPCAKNIQRIVSIFVNQSGRICMRVFMDIIRASAYVKPLQLGEWVEMAINLTDRVVTFNIWPRNFTGWPEPNGTPSSTAVFKYGQRLTRLSGQATEKTIKLNEGHLACVVKNVGVTLTLGS